MNAAGLLLSQSNKSQIMKSFNAFVFTIITIATTLATFLTWFLLYMR